MATIVVHQPTGQRYVLVGAGYGMFQSERPGVFWGNLEPVRSRGSVSLIAVANAAGQIGWFGSQELVVESIDGRTPAEQLGIG